MTPCTDGKMPDRLFWERQNLPDYAPVRVNTPLRDAGLTQIAPGPYSVTTRVMSAGDIAIARSAITCPSVGVLVQHPGQLLFFAPQRWDGALKVNGRFAESGQLHLADGDGCFHVVGGSRETLGVAVDKDLFLRTVSALTGRTGISGLPTTGALDIPPVIFSRLRRALLESLWRPADATGQTPVIETRETLFELLIDAYLSAQPARDLGEVVCRHPGQIVRIVEECIESAADQHLSLADLCAAAGVSKNTLYKAFHSYCEMSPLAYIQRRRLAMARSQLVAARSDRELVKRVALSVGLTQLGRFSVEYRKLFGESPSSTLNNLSL